MTTPTQLLPELDPTTPARWFIGLGSPVLGMRVMNGSDVRSGLFDSPTAFAECAIRWSDRGYNVYANINDVEPGDRSVTNSVTHGKAVGESQIRRVRILPLDFDPIRQHPSGGKVCSSDDEHAAALACAQAAQDWARAQGWPDPIATDSGNGAGLFYHVDLPNEPATKSLIKKLLRRFATQFDNDRVRVDQSVFDPPRVFRVPGTVNHKQAVEGRPQRRARIL